MVKRKPPETPKRKGSILDDLCPICGEAVEEGEPWVLIDGQMVHERCEPDAHSTMNKEQS